MQLELDQGHLSAEAQSEGPEQLPGHPGPLPAKEPPFRIAIPKREAEGVGEVAKSLVYRWGLQQGKGFCRQVVASKASDLGPSTRRGASLE